MLSAVKTLASPPAPFTSTFSHSKSSRVPGVSGRTYTACLIGMAPSCCSLRQVRTTQVRRVRRQLVYEEQPTATRLAVLAGGGSGRRGNFRTPGHPPPCPRLVVTFVAEYRRALRQSIRVPGSGERLTALLVGAVRERRVESHPPCGISEHRPGGGDAACRRTRAGCPPQESPRTRCSRAAAPWVPHSAGASERSGERSLEPEPCANHSSRAESR